MGQLHDFFKWLFVVECARNTKEMAEVCRVQEVKRTRRSMLGLNKKYVHNSKSVKRVSCKETHQFNVIILRIFVKNGIDGASLKMD